VKLAIHRLTLLLPLDFNEVEDPGGIAQDASEFKFFFYANYEGGVTVSIGDRADIPKALPLIRQAHLIANA
jgi:predicted transport protein